MGKSWKRILNFSSWKKIILILVNTNIYSSETKISVAKIWEIENWKDHSVYEEVQNEGHNSVSVIWVVANKSKLVY